MELISHDYSKERSEFGHRPKFGDFTNEVLSVDTTDAHADSDQWICRTTTTVDLTCIPGQSQHTVETQRFVQVAKGTSHTEGAWPVDVKTNDWTDRQRLLRRVKNEPGYQTSVVNLIKTAEGAIKQNNTIDLFEEYFNHPEIVESFAIEPPSAITVSVFRDPNEVKRSATKISWHPDSDNKLAVSYSILQFQQMPKNMPLASYIWDINSPNEPDRKIIPNSPLSCLEFNPRSPDHIVGGSYNGLIAFWDLRKGSQPLETSLIEHSHHDPVYDVSWVQSRTGYECCSVSTDGQLLWWDSRNLKAGPHDRMKLQDAKAQGDDAGITYGGTAMEYKSDAGATRYLCGTEQGVVLLCDRKAKKDSESQKSIKSIFGRNTGRHHGPIYSVERNPNQLKYFLTVGDWTARVWMEDLKTPILTTRYDGSYLTAGCWSPSRAGVFFTTKMDGTLDCWDLLHKQNAPSFSTKVGEGGLSSMKIHSGGSLLALGSLDGSATVLKLSGALSTPVQDEKNKMGQIFERETKRERNLEMRYHQRKTRKQKVETKEPEFDPYEDDDPETKAILDQVEKSFYELIDLSSNTLLADGDGDRDSKYDSKSNEESI